MTNVIVVKKNKCINIYYSNIYELYFIFKTCGHDLDDHNCVYGGRSCQCSRGIARALKGPFPSI